METNIMRHRCVINVPSRKESQIEAGSQLETDIKRDSDRETETVRQRQRQRDRETEGQRQRLTKGQRQRGKTGKKTIQELRQREEKQNRDDEFRRTVTK